MTLNISRWKPQTHAFSQSLASKKILLSRQLLHKNWPSRKPQTLYMTLTIKIQSKLVAKVSQKFNSNNEWELTSLHIIRACFITTKQKPIFFLRLSISLFMVMAVFSKTIRLILKQREQYSMHIPKMITPVGLNTEGDRVSFFNFNW